MKKRDPRKYTWKIPSNLIWLFRIWPHCETYYWYSTKCIRNNLFDNLMTIYFSSHWKKENTFLTSQPNVTSKGIATPLYCVWSKLSSSPQYWRVNILKHIIDYRLLSHGLWEWTWRDCVLYVRHAWKCRNMSARDKKMRSLCWILSQWAWFSVSTRSFIGSDQNSAHPLLITWWIARSTFTRGSYVFNAREHRVSRDASVRK